MKATIKLEVTDSDTLDTFVSMLRKELKTYFGKVTPRSNIIYTNGGSMSLDIDSLDILKKPKLPAHEIRYGNII